MFRHLQVSSTFLKKGLLLFIIDGKNWILKSFYMFNLSEVIQYQG